MTDPTLRVDWLPAWRIGAIAGTPHEDVVTDHPDVAAYWRLNETTGTTATDVVSGDDGTYSGDYVLDQPGATYDGDRAVHFGDYSKSVGGNGRVTVPNSSTFENTDYSVSCWIKTFGRPGATAQEIVTRDAADPGRQFILRLDGAGLPTAVVLPGVTTGFVSIAGTVPVDDGRWHHLVLSDTGTQVTLYVDGAQVATAARGTAGVNVSTPIVIASNNRTANQLIGTIDEVAYFTPSISLADVEDLYDSRRAVGDWEEMPGCLRSLRLERGSQRSLDRGEPAHASLMFGDPDRELDPTESTSLMVANIPVRTVAILSATDYPMSTVLIDRPKPEWEIGDQRASITGSDETKRLNRILLAPTPFDVAVTEDQPIAWWRCDDADLTDLDDRAGDHDGGWPGGDPPVTATTPALARAAGYPAAYFGPTGDGFPGRGQVLGFQAPSLGRSFCIEFGIRLGRQGSGTRYVLADSSIVAFVHPTGSNSGRVQFGFGGTSVIAVGTTRVDDENPHHVLIRQTPANVKVYIDGADVTSSIIHNEVNHTGSLLQFGIDAALAKANALGGLNGSTLGPVIFYDHPLSAARVAVHADAFLNAWAGDDTGERVHRALDVADVAPTMRSIDAGTQTLGPSSTDHSAREHIRLVEVSEDGQFRFDRSGVATFVERTDPTVGDLEVDCTEGVGPGPYLPYTELDLDPGDTRLRTRVTATREFGTTQEDRIDSRHGDITEDLGTVLLSDAPATRTLVGRVLSRLSVDRVRIESVEFVANGFTDDQWIAILTAEQGTTCTVTARPPAGAAFSQPSIVTHITEAWDARSRTWAITWQLEPIPT